MPGGSHCAIPGCHTQGSKCRGLSFHTLPKKEKDAAWKAKLIDAINRADKSFNPDKAKICSRHFKEDCFRTSPSGKRLLIPGSLPTEWMPSKSIVTPKPEPRKDPFPREPPMVKERVAYFNFEEVKKDVAAPQSLPSSWCLLETCDKHLTVGMMDQAKTRALVKLCISDDFSVQASVFGMSVPGFKGSIEAIKIRQYLQDMSSCRICPGVTDPQLQSFADSSTSTDNSQVYFKQMDVCLKNEKDCQSVVRSVRCCLLFQKGEKVQMCKGCAYAKRLLIKKKQRHEKSISRPLTKNAPLHTTPKEKLVAHVKQSRKQVNLLEKEIEELRKFKNSLHSESVNLKPELSSSLKNVVENMAEDENKLVKLFWEEQCRAFGTKPNGMRWHPMLIRLAILVHSRSPAAYETLRKTGVLKLPGQSTLRDYTNAIQPRSGFSSLAIDELKRLSKDLPDNDRFVVLLHDEMVIKSDLVYDARSGEVIGFVNSTEWKETLNSKIASSVLDFFVVGINNKINLSLGFFGTSSSSSTELFSLFWEAVAYLEITCNLKVIASVSDKASANQKHYQLHRVPADGEEICFKATNLLCPSRHVFFISDPPHLIKTVRNNLSNSGVGRHPHLLWNEGKYIVWEHVRKLYDIDTQTETRCTKLTSQHVNLTSTTRMSVRLAAQVLSASVGKMMRKHLGPDAEGTVQLILMMNRFFDCLNGHYMSEGHRQRNKDLDPYVSVDDERLQFLEVDFLGYLNAWKQSVSGRLGDFTPQQRRKMFLTHQTFKGLVMTVKAFCEATRYLLGNGVPHLLSSVFCQDPLEEHFGRHRSMGRRSDNPTMHAFAHQENKIRIGRSLASQFQPKGNAAGKRQQKMPVEMSSSPLKKRKKE